MRIERIYNRVIFDELMRRPDLKLPFSFQEELDVKWVGHPNWYFRISKHSLPFLKTEHTAPGLFRGRISAEGESLEDYVLKPLYSFAGLGVDMEPTRKNSRALAKAARMDFAKESHLRGIRPDRRRPKIESGNPNDVYLAGRGRSRCW